MSGAGSYSAGTGSPAGLDVPVTTTPATPLTLAPSYDPLLRIVDPTVQVHWVDQAVPFLLGNIKGTLPGLPRVGLDRARLKFATRLNAASLVSDVVLNDCLASLVAQKAIKVLSIAVAYRSGSLAFEVEYKNMLSPNAKPLKVKVT